ncbi:hypothetical protein KXD93_02045 [Mucilaginibacter sp. BJC16-A38]|uniref:hypothetical protein n=1 Tax=Mucilaginibacter phenanthrenivorans TaxID=1234842 RepID=UPI0021583A68|nr:hypothetical protein [Mucilaginibacter phenanthrenivorans]MCR8556402.1 hypothetical protein [Mucilaginibacter phenanthrenivorans]
MNAKSTVGTVTLYLVTYLVLFFSGCSTPLLVCMFLASPFLIIGMVYIVIKDDRYQYPELKEGEEWSYRDKKKETLGLFW